MSIIVAIDGLSGVGKSTAARTTAAFLGVPCLHTGQMYRALALRARRKGVDPDDTPAIESLARCTVIEFDALGSCCGQRVIVDGEDVTADVNTEAIAVLATRISKESAVRQLLVLRQKDIISTWSTGGVVEGRDTTAIVCPTADVKVLLTASPEVRARRQLARLASLDITARLADVLKEQEERDKWPDWPGGSPLCASAGVVVIDTERLTAQDVVGRILRLCQGAKPG